MSSLENVRFLNLQIRREYTLSLQSIDNIHGSDSLPLCMFGIGDSITDDIFQENLKDTSGFFINQTRNTLDTTSTRQTTNGRFGDTLDIITQDFSVTFSTSL